MSWKLRCPFCQTSYKIEPEHQGTVCKCAECGKEFSIPDDIQSWLDSMPDPPASGRGGSERRAAAPDPADDDPVQRAELRRRRRNLMYCPHCGEEYKIKTEYLGKKYRCIMCEEVFVVPDAEQLRLANTVNCPTCLARVSPKADRCPYCGGKMPLLVPWYKNLFCGIIIFFGAIIMLLSLGTLLLPSSGGSGRQSAVIPSLVSLGIGAILFFGGGSARRQR